MYVYRSRKKNSLERLARGSVVFVLVAVAYASILAGIVTIFSSADNPTALARGSFAGIEPAGHDRPASSDEGQKRITLLLQ